MKYKWHLVLMLLLALTALTYHAWTLWSGYLQPAFRGERGFIEDFQYYYDAASRFIANPGGLYVPFGGLDDFAFIYPPLCVLGFLPITLVPLNVSYLLWILAGYASLYAALYLLVNMLTASGLRLRSTHLYIAFVATAAMGPTFTNSAAGNVNAVLLLFSVASVYFVYNSKDGTGGFILCLAIWLKVYPIILAPLLLLYATRRVRFILGMLAGMVIMPVLFLPMVPYSLYKEYVFEVLPNLSGHITLHAFNQSFAASVGRFWLPGSVATSWGYPDVHHAVKIAGYLVGMATLLVALVLAFRKDRRYMPVLSLLPLAVIPLVTPFGWGYAYMLSLPLFAYAVFASDILRNIYVKCLTLFVFIMILIPAWRLSPFEKLHFVSTLYYARYPASVLILFGMTAWTIMGQQSASLYRGSATRSTPESEP